MNPDQLLDKAKGIYVVLLKRPDDGRFVLLPDPGLNRPWSCKNFKLADKMCTDVCRELACQGTVKTLEDAFNFLMKQDAKSAENLYNQIVPKK